MSLRAVPGERAVVWVDGPDAASFLQGLVSNDVIGPVTGTSVPALLLDATGHVRVDLVAVRTAPDAFTLITALDQGPRLAELLDEYHFSEDVEILGPEPVGHVTFLAPGVAVPAGSADLVLDGRIPGTTEAIGADPAAIAAAAGAGPAEAEALEACRIAAGVPRFGADMTDRTLVHEAGLERDAVSFGKGCYLGQETVARVQYRGGVRRRLAGLRTPAPASPGAVVTFDGREVGRVTSSARHPRLGPLALALLRTEVAPGARVEVEGIDGPAVVAGLPFAGDGG